MPGLKQRIKQARSTRRGKVILAGIVLFLLALLAGGIVYWQVAKKRLIRHRLETSIREKSRGLYSISYDKLELDEVSGFLSVTNMRLEYDSARYAGMVANHTAPSFLFSIRIPALTVYGVKTPRALISKEITGRKIEIIDPLIDIIFTSAGKDSARYSPTQEVYRQILGDLQLISIDTFQLSGGIITTSDLQTQHQNIGLYNPFIELVNIKIDSVANADTTRLLFSENIRFRCDSLFWKTPDKLYKIGGDTLSLSSVNNEVYINHFYIQPMWPEQTFMQQVPTQTDRLDFSIRDIAIRNLDFLQLFNENIIADSLTIGSAAFRLYRDLAIPRDKKNRVGTYPQQVIAALPVPLEIKTLVARNTFIEYKERSDKTGRAGRVQFDKAEAVFSNVTNKKAAGGADNRMTVHINTLFLGKIPFETDWVFYHHHPDGRFDVKGRLGSVAVKELNELLIPMGPARMEDGNINQLYFNFAGSDHTMKGDVTFLYDNLKITLLEKDDESKKLEKKGLASFIANIVIKKSNPQKKNEPISVQVENQRDTNRSIFHFAWHSLLAGIKQTLGIEKK